MRPAVLKCEGHSRATLGSWLRESGVYSSRKEEVKMSVYFSSWFNTENIVRHVVTGLCGEGCHVMYPVCPTHV